jgi:hypothetical protein
MLSNNEMRISRARNARATRFVVGSDIKGRRSVLGSQCALYDLQALFSQQGRKNRISLNGAHFHGELCRDLPAKSTSIRTCVYNGSPLN